MNQLSSGDMLADRRADYARMLSDNNEHQGAAELMVQSLELAPAWAAGWFQLAEYEEKSGRNEAAVIALRQVLDLSPGDAFGAGLKLAILSGNATTNLPSSRYIEQLFDDYPGRFDDALVERLDYTVPEKLLALVQSQVGLDHRFSCVADLGCGTGLFGARIRRNTDRLEGFDLSANMLAKARDKQIYDRLDQADLSLEPDLSGVFAEGYPAHRADLAAAADVLIYLGDLHRVFSIAAKLVADNGFFAFSVEDAGSDAGIVLRSSLRYAHSESYVCGLLEAHGFAVDQMARTAIRKDGGNIIPGILFLARMRA